MTKEQQQDLIIGEVKKMRKAQKQFFKYRDNSSLREAKKYEQIVDTLIQRIDDKQKEIKF